jgi:SpoVK/Ycf46/Vps4 family AAA+-type ATPase
MKWTKGSITKKDLDRLASYAMVDTVSYEDGAFPEAVEEIQPEKITVSMHNLNGLHSSSVTYSGLLNPVCKYALTKMVNANSDHRFVTANSYSKRPTTIEIPTDVDQVESVYDDLKAIYDDKIVTASDSYGNFTVTCYSKDIKVAKNFVKTLKQKMASDNQYRGKCLFFGGDGVIYRENPTVNWDDVILTEKSKKEIALNTISFLKNPEYRKLGMNSRGLILHGPPGTGKTMVVKSLFKSLGNEGVTRVYATADTFTYPGMVSNLFDFLKFTGSTALAFEDMDLISGERSEGGGRKVLGALLNNLDGLRQIQDPLVIIGTTNDVGMLDHALANRPCRFDRKIEVPLPGDDEKRKFYKILLENDVNDDIISASSGFSGAHIREAVNTARMLSMEYGKTLDECIPLACEVIRDNFFPMTKEASKKLKEGLTKEANQFYIIPFDSIMNSPGFMNLFPMMMNKPHEVTDKEATTLWNLWKGQDGNIKDNKIALNQKVNKADIESLKGKEIVEINGDVISLTDKGKKVLRSMILATEVSTFDNKLTEPENISMNDVQRKIRGGSQRRVKAASKEEVKNVKIESDTDWHYEAIKNLGK